MTLVLTLGDFAGAQKEGAAGFFKGVGKGLVGAVARPTGGIIDMASSTFQGIKRYLSSCLCEHTRRLSFTLSSFVAIFTSRAAETSQDIESLRPPRFIHEDGVIRPYKEREGVGSQMLQVGPMFARRHSSYSDVGIVPVCVLFVCDFSEFVSILSKVTKD